MLDPSRSYFAFWYHKQFHKTPTHLQNIFDWSFGVVMPIICIVFDPIVFRGHDNWGPSLKIIGIPHRLSWVAGRYADYFYWFMLIQIVALAFYLIFRKHTVFLAGAFTFAAFYALFLGLCIFPLSLLGLMILIGALGFTPLFTSLVYGRNAVRILLQVRHHDWMINTFLFLLGVFVCVELPMVIYWLYPNFLILIL